MSRGRNRRKAALQGEWSERMHQAHAELAAQSPDGRVMFHDLKRLATERYRSVPRDAAEIRRLADICRNCGKPGHWERDCPERICRACGEAGHIKAQCPKASM